MQRPVLNDFQLATERALAEALDGRGIRLENVEVTGETETCIRASLGGSGLEVFVYEDGAGILGPSLDRRFEVEDFAGLEALRQAFVLEAVEWAARSARSD
jgi:hypothetical protein